MPGNREIIASGLHKGKPKCTVEGCELPGQHTGHYRKDGSIYYRNLCSAHHAIRYNMDGGYRLHKKSYCENIDGRLGYVCTSTILDSCQLDVDHANSDHEDNRIENLDTLCRCCHSYKTIQFSRYDQLELLREIYSQNRSKFQVTQNI